MTAPRAREQAGPPAPPERRPPRRGGGSSPYTYAASAAGRPAGGLGAPARRARRLPGRVASRSCADGNLGRKDAACAPRGGRRGLVRSARVLAAAALLALSGALALPATAEARQSDDATLSALVVNDGSTDLPLEPTFKPSTARFIDEYYVDVSHDVATVTVTATPNHSGATVEYSPSNPVSLEVGYQTIRIDVTSEDDDEDNTYKVGVFRAPPATPSCTLNSGDIWCSLLPVSPSSAGLLGASIEDLSDFDFTYKDRTYRFRLIRLNADQLIVVFYPLNAFVAGSARIALDDLQLQVGSASFRFSEGRSSPNWFYRWDNSGLQWSSGTTVTVRVRPNPALTVRAPAGTAGLLEAIWTAPIGSAYEVQYWPADEDGRMFQTKWTTDMNVLIWPLDADTEYKVRVRARSATGWGDWSEVATARTGAEQSGRPRVSLHLLNSSGSEITEGAITEGKSVRYRLKATNIRNYHDWEGPGLLAKVRVNAHVLGDRHYPQPALAGRVTCWDEPLLRKGLSETQPSFTRTSVTTGYWDFETKPLVIPIGYAEYGPLTLSIQRQRCGELGDPPLRAPDIGAPSSACVTIADNNLGPAYDYADSDALQETLTEKPTYSCSDVRSTRPLKGRFVSPPAQHDGQKAVEVQVAFSDSVYESEENVGEHGVRVDGGRVTSSKRVGRHPAGSAQAHSATRSATGTAGGADDYEYRWEFGIEPDADGDVTVSLDAVHACDAPGAICTSDGRALSPGISTTVEGPGSGPAALTASFEDMPETHDGESAFRFRVAFSEEIKIRLPALREDAFTVTGGRVTGVGRVDRRNDLFQIKVEPAGDGDVTITLPEGRDCATSGAICTKGENRRQLTNTPTATVAGPASGSAALTARFEDMPETHDGESVFRFRVAFSEDIGISYRSLREDAFTMSGGRVTSGLRVDDRRDLFEMTVEPDGDGDVTITLPEGRDCTMSGAICTKGENRRQLTNTPTATVAGPADDVPEPNTPTTGAPTIGGTPQVGEELTASTSGISDADGLDDARFAYQWIRAGADIQGATGSTYTPVAADEGKRLKVRVSFTDDAGNEESLTSAATAAVAALPEPLTASFEGMPAEHDGQGSFSFRVAFSEGIRISYKTVRDASFTVTAGEVTQARRVDGRRDLWKITIEPDSDEAVTVRLPETTDCDTSGAICTGDGRPLSHALSATVAGPVGISVADARVEEGEGTVLAFLVTLSRTLGAALTVDYATADGSAHAGDDYQAASGTLKFRAGESSQRIEVAVLDDDHDEGEETLTLTLSNASSGRLTDGAATGTIENRDPLPRALLARFGRTAAVHVVEQVEARLEARRAPGFEGRFAGRAVRPGMEREVAESFLRRLGGQAGAGSTRAGDPMADVHDPLERRTRLSGAAGGAAAGGALGGGGGLEGAFSGEGLLRLGLGGGDVLTGSGFALNRATRHGGTVSLWSRGAQSRFSGREGALSLGGAVRTTMFGADYVRGRLTAGLSLSHSGGVGEYAGHGLGEVVSSVTGLYPWLGYQATDRISVWGVAGYGSGTLSLTPEGGTALASDLGMALGALGARGELLGAAGYGLAFKADALWVGTAIEGVDGPSGRLKATSAAVTRLRTALEGSRDFRFGSGLSLKPSVEVGVRRDGGDAETGAGLDMGGGVVVTAPSVGLSADVKVRMLLAHEAEEFRERGVSVSLSYNPTPATPFGLRARLSPSWGGQATSGAEALWGRETLSGMASGGFGAAGSRLNADIGYGMPVGRRLVGTPRLAVMTSGMGRDYRLGYGLGVLGDGPLRFELGIDAQRRETPLAGRTNHGVAARATLSW